MQLIFKGKLRKILHAYARNQQQLPELCECARVCVRVFCQCVCGRVKINKLAVVVIASLAQHVPQPAHALNRPYGK